MGYAASMWGRFRRSLGSRLDDLELRIERIERMRVLQAAEHEDQVSRLEGIYRRTSARESRSGNVRFRDNQGREA